MFDFHGWWIDSTSFSYIFQGPTTPPSSTRGSSGREKNLPASSCDKSFTQSQFPDCWFVVPLVILFPGRYISHSTFNKLAFSFEKLNLQRFVAKWIWHLEGPDLAKRKFANLGEVRFQTSTPKLQICWWRCFLETVGCHMKINFGGK